MDGDICVTNIVQFDTRRGFTFIEVGGHTVDNEVTREYLGTISKLEFVGRIGYTIWMIEKKSIREFEKFCGVDVIKKREPKRQYKIYARRYKMKRRKYTKSRRQVIAKRYPKSTLSGYPCFNKTVYPNEIEAEKGATIMWGKDTRVDRRDVHGYECPDGCKFEGKNGWHIGHRSYYQKFVERRQEVMRESANAQLSSV